MDTKVIIESKPYRVGEWLPTDQTILCNWLEDLSNEVENDKKPFHPVISDLQHLIETDAEIFALINLAFEQVPEKYKYSQYGKQVRDYHHFLQLLNAVMTKSPTYNDTGCVGFPINAILDWSMGTEGGFAAFLNDKLNAQFKKVLQHWGTFLNSVDSNYVLSIDNHPIQGSGHKLTKQYCWLSDKAMVAMMNMMRQHKEPIKPEEHAKARLEFIDTFQCDPRDEHYGFTCWDDFFTREFRDGKRPIAAEGNDNVIVNACESAPYRVTKGNDVKLRNQFWIKGQPYSLSHMLNNDKRAEQFVGGTVYQAFLSAKSYHRWNCPISGTIIKTQMVDGSYYSETPVAGYDDAAPNDSQGYIAEVATRAVIFIEADNPAIGLMAIVFIGMAEVSSCDIRVYEGQKVSKGQPMGTFHFGGSSHCMLFRKEVELEFDLMGQKPGLNTFNLCVNSKLATIK
ncbi:MAG: phosphatidylserine decarboxylase [Psychromonas sp.]|jgi:phosphatidylserine decarboxylase|uniref:phosphatidylserine decarboxylase family protein n=1 Tax=Psychromonas sp. TaxID=1884585 RepID=UPI0039E35046